MVYKEQKSMKNISYALWKSSLLKFQIEEQIKNYYGVIYYFQRFQASI